MNGCIEWDSQINELYFVLLTANGQFVRWLK